MTDKTAHKDKVEHPAQNYARPADLVRDEELSVEEKKKALDVWEQDARQLVTASNEGMEGESIGPDRDENHKLDQVLDAKQKVGARLEAQAGALSFLVGEGELCHARARRGPGHSRF
jgi:hypothetical protein